MTQGSNAFSLKKTLAEIDWKLLLFLTLFLDVKLIVKVPAIILIYLLQFNFKFGFRLKNSRLPLFYVLILVIPFIDLLTGKGFHEVNYLVVFFTGIGFWVLCLLAIHQVKLSVENNSAAVIQKTIVVFFLINAVVSLCNIGLIMIETGSINPYTYQGEYQKYFIGTGDYIRGLTFDTSTTNAVLNAFGVLYFLDKKKPLMVLICMAILLLTGSNVINVVLLLILTILFIFKSSREQKSLVAICFMFLVVFMAKISPQNDKYVFHSILNFFNPPNERVAVSTNTPLDDHFTDVVKVRRKFAQDYIDSVYTANLKTPLVPAPKGPPPLPAWHGRVLIVPPNINKPPYVPRNDTTAEERQLLTFIDTHKSELPMASRPFYQPGLPGKVTGLLQTVKFLRREPAKILAGAGIGNFSSKIAFKATGLGFQGTYPAKLIYISKDFLSNHLDIYLDFFSKKDGLHSLINSPFSVYDQLLAEYGLLGLLAFILFYLGFFTKHYKKLTYGIPVLAFMLSMFFIDYWFEQLSVLVFFELLLLLNIKETSYLKLVPYGNK